MSSRRRLAEGRHPRGSRLSTEARFSGCRTSGCVGTADTPAARNNTRRKIKEDGARLCGWIRRLFFSKPGRCGRARGATSHLPVRKRKEMKKRRVEMEGRAQSGTAKATSHSRQSPRIHRPSATRPPSKIKHRRAGGGWPEWGAQRVRVGISKGTLTRPLCEGDLQIASRGPLKRARGVVGKAFGRLRAVRPLQPGRRKERKGERKRESRPITARAACPHSANGTVRFATTAGRRSSRR